jgi:DNA-binding TFAR19-related protein (PDSD5 family)
MLSCGSNKAFLNTIQEDDEETKEDTEAEEDGLRYHHAQGRNFTQVADEESERSQDTLSQFLNDEMKEPHRLARVRLERLAAKRVDTMINSSFSKEFKNTSNKFQQYCRPESESHLTAAFV